MHQAASTHAESPSELYADLRLQVRGLLEGERDMIANAANFTALVFHALPEVNWAGFYLFDGTELVVGPFQGQPACVRIALGSGVCGTAAHSGQTQLVEDVYAFPGHIFCDAASRSEVVVPLFREDGSLFGVWDVDSARPARFGESDRDGMQDLCTEFMAALQQ